MTWIVPAQLQRPRVSHTHSRFFLTWSNRKLTRYALRAVPDVLQIFDRIDNARAVQLPDLSQLSSDADLSAAQEIIDEAAFALQDELTLFAIEHYGANAVLSFAIEGPLPVQDEELVAQGYVSP